MKAFLIKITAAALNLCNAIVSSLWVLILTGTSVIGVFAFIPDLTGAGESWARPVQSLASLVPFMGTYMLSSICLRRILLDKLGGDLPAVFAVGVVIFFIGHLSLVIGLGMQAGYWFFQPEEIFNIESFRSLHADLDYQTRVLNVTVFGAISCILFMLPCFVFYLLSRERGEALAAQHEVAPSCFDMMFSKPVFLTSGILAAVIIFLAFVVTW